jgi:WD40 repeat protein
MALLETGLARKLSGCVGAMFCVSWSPDGKRIAAGGEQQLHIWTIPGPDTMSCVGHLGTVWSVSFSPNSQLFCSGSNDKTCKLWTTGRLTFFQPQMRPDGGLVRSVDVGAKVKSVAFFSDKAFLTGDYDWKCKLWSLGHIKDPCETQIC